MFKKNKYYCDYCGKEITGRCNKRLERVKNHFCNNQCKFAIKLNKVEIQNNITIIYVKNSKHEHQCLVDTKDYIDKIKPLNCTLLAYENYKSKKPYVYFQEKITKKKIKLHRYLTNCPENMIIDHINGNVLDNRQENLRIVDLTINGQNRLASSNNKSSGIRGVYWSKKRKKLNGLVQVNNKRKNLGYFVSKEDCINAVMEYRQKQLIEYQNKLML